MNVVLNLSPVKALTKNAPACAGSRGTNSGQFALLTSYCALLYHRARASRNYRPISCPGIEPTASEENGLELVTLRETLQPGASGDRGGCAWARIAREVREDRLDHDQVFDAREDAQRAATVCAGLNVDAEHA